MDMRWSIIRSLSGKMKNPLKFWQKNIKFCLKMSNFSESWRTFLFRSKFLTKIWKFSKFQNIFFIFLPESGRTFLFRLKIDKFSKFQNIFLSDFERIFYIFSFKIYKQEKFLIKFLKHSQSLLKNLSGCTPGSWQSCLKLLILKNTTCFGSTNYYSWKWNLWTEHEVL